MRLKHFERALVELVGRPTSLRPFVCDGSPLTCEIFIVGANAATSMDQFWDFWHPRTGMDKAAWFEAYKTERAHGPLPPGKKRGRLVTPTRSNIDRVVEGASPSPCLETNVYSVASSSTVLLGSTDRSTSIFEFLLESIKPKLVLAHGREAARAVKALDLSTPVREVRHLSRTSGEQARSLGRELRAQLEAAV